MALSHDAPWSDWVAPAWQRAQERDGHTKIEECPGALWAHARIDEKATVASVLGAVIDGSDREFDRVFIGWMKRRTNDLIPPDLMLALLDHLAKVDPPLACIVYQDERELTDEEDASLLAGINASNMTTMREKIARREVSREKDRIGVRVR